MPPDQEALDSSVSIALHSSPPHRKASLASCRTTQSPDSPPRSRPVLQSRGRPTEFMPWLAKSLSPTADSSHEYGWYDGDDQPRITPNASDIASALAAAHPIAVLNRFDTIRDNDFGFGEGLAPSSPCSTSSASTGDNSSNSSGNDSSKGGEDSPTEILFQLNQRNFETTTKVFEDLTLNKSYCLVLGLGGFRIVQASAGQHAEYNVTICINEQAYSVWRRYSAFSDLLLEARHLQPEYQLRKSIAAWEGMQKRRKWGRCLDIRYLAQKLSHLEEFMKKLTEELRSPLVLVRFATGTSVSSRIHQPTWENVFG